MEKENVNPQPHNFISVNSANTYPEDLHDAFELPGEYQQIESPYAYTYNGKDKYMDYVESVGPDGDVIIEDSANNVEFQFDAIPNTKKRIIYNYKNSTIIRLHKPTLNFVAINYTPKNLTENLTENYEINGDILKIQYIIFDEENSYKILNNTKNKYENTHILLGIDFMLWVQSIAFLEESYATDFLKESVELFTSLENVDNSFLLFLHLSHKVMIKNFIKDKDERRRLLTMITKSLKKTDVKNAVGLEKVYIEHEQYKNELKALKAENRYLRAKLNESPK